MQKCINLILLTQLIHWIWNVSYNISGFVVPRIQNLHHKVCAWKQFLFFCECSDMFFYIYYYPTYSCHRSLIWGICERLLGMGLNNPLNDLWVSQSNFQVSPWAQKPLFCIYSSMSPILIIQYIVKSYKSCLMIMIW